MSDFEREPVPAASRKGWWSFVIVYLAVGIDLSAMILGTELGRNFTLSDALLAVAVGSAVLGVLGGLCANVGSRTGLSTAMIVESTFGRVGAKLISGLFGISLLGWFGVQAGFLGTSGRFALAELGISVSKTTVTIVGGGLMTLTAVFGYAALERLSRFSVPLMLGLLAVALTRALTQPGVWDAVVAAQPERPLSFGQGVSFVIGIFVTGAVIAPDLARWARSNRDGIAGTFVGFFVGNSLMLVAALLLSKAVGQSDIVLVFAQLGMALWAILILTLGQWTTNSGNLYHAVLSLSVLFRRAPRVVLALLGGLLGTGLAVFGLYDHFTQFLSVVTALVVPVAGVYLAEFYFSSNAKRVSVRAEPQNQPAVVGRAAVSWLLGAGLVLCSTPKSEGGWGLFTVSRVPALDGVMLAFVVQTVTSMIVRAGWWGSTMQGGSGQCGNSRTKISTGSL